MTQWTYDAEHRSGLLVVEGDLTINQVAHYRERLLEAFAVADLVTVDVSAATAVDVAGLQLLWAARCFSADRDKQLSLRLEGNRRFLDFLDEVGFPRDFIGRPDQAAGRS